LIISQTNIGKISQGTGVLIGKNTVLTVAHNLYRKFRNPLKKDSKINSYPDIPEFI
jgi:V8-like Glu-specific endopeptidase